jgi:hypothetical protein
MTTINWLMLLKEIIAVYSENPKKPRNTLCRKNAEQLNVNEGGTCNYQCALKA